jgi:hypothetical protein
MTLIASAKRFMHMATTSTPAAGELALFAKPDNALWVKKSDGSEQTVGGLVGTTPATAVAMTPNTGWTGASVIASRFGSEVTLWFSGNKASYSVNENMFTTALPAELRPLQNTPVVGMNSAVDNAPRTAWIGGDGIIKMGAAGTGSFWGAVTYQAAAVPGSSAMASGAEGVITAGPKTTIHSTSRAYLRGGMVTLNLNVILNSPLAAGDVLFNVPDGFRPPTDMFEDWIYAAATEQTVRFHLSPAGAATHQGSMTGAAGNVFRGTINYPAAISAAGLGTLVDTGWVSYPSINVPNVPCTTNFYKVRRVGNTVTTRAVVTLTAGIGPAYVDLPYPMATGTLLSDTHIIGRVRALRSGVSWYPFDLCAERLSPGRAMIMMQDGSGVQVTNGTPAAFASGDRWGIEYEYEAAPL